jgi:hypothetical protein
MLPDAPLIAADAPYARNQHLTMTGAELFRWRLFLSAGLGVPLARSRWSRWCGSSRSVSVERFRRADHLAPAHHAGSRRRLSPVLVSAINNVPL